MKTATLLRLSTGDEGTFGALVLDDGFGLHTLELPWENNERSVSCIPCGTYLVETTDSPRFGSVFKILDVPDRTDILFHRGNWAGRKSMPELHSNVDGCVLLGQDRGILEGQKCVKSSSNACDEFYAHLKLEQFELLILSRVNNESFDPAF